MKDNKLIAEFMGLRTNSYGDYNIDKDVMGFDMIVCSLADTKYHTSWDWLMPVVESCLIIDSSSLFERLDARDNSADEIKRELLVCNLKGVYTAVVEFINEHNKYICGSCGDHVNEVVFNKDSDVDECTNCTEYYDR